MAGHHRLMSVILDRKKKLDLAVIILWFAMMGPVTTPDSIRQLERGMDFDKIVQSVSNNAAKMIVAWATLFFSNKFQRWLILMLAWIKVELTKVGAGYTDVHKALLIRVALMTQAISPLQKVINDAFDAYNGVDTEREGKARLAGFFFNYRILFLCCFLLY